MNTEPTNQPPEWAVKAAIEVCAHMNLNQESASSVAAIIASHAPKGVNQRLIDALKMIVAMEEPSFSSRIPIQVFPNELEIIKSALKSAEQSAR